ncbi:MAG: hypothetical protein SGCHY_003680 [Lobulomycetales sp.]
MAETAEQEVVVSFTSTLLTLTWNSKDIINALTIHAHTHTRYATALTTALALHLGISFSGTDHICNRRMQAPRKVGFAYSLGIIHLLARYVLGGTPNAARLPSLYALDSILKNIGAPYPALIAPALPRVIETVWSLCTAPEDRARISKVIGTWANYNGRPIFPVETMSALAQITGAYPVPINQSASIGGSSSAPPSRPSSVQPVDHSLAKDGSSLSSLASSIISKIPLGVSLTPLMTYLTNTRPPDPQHVLAILAALFPPVTELPHKLSGILRALPYNTATIRTHESDPDQLYDAALPLVCNQCGRRWKKGKEEEKAQHLDWHFRVNRRTRGEGLSGQISREWYFDVTAWVEEDASSVVDLNTVPGAEDASSAALMNGQNGEDGGGQVRAAHDVVDSTCRVCGETFERFWSEEEEEWMIRNVIQTPDGVVVHYACWVDQGGFAGLKRTQRIMEAESEQESSGSDKKIKLEKE